MVAVDTSLKYLTKLVGKKLKESELESALFDMGFEMECDGDDLRVEVTPDRPDLVSAQGLARALRAYLSIKKGIPVYKVKKSPVKVIVKPSVKSVRPFTVAAVVKNLKLDHDKIKDIMWIQEKLHATFARKRKKAAIGVYPLGLITSPITYSGENPDKIKFIPLESDKLMSGKQILTNHPTGKQYAKLLDGYDKFPFFIDAKSKVLSMPPIINSQELGRVEVSTKDVFIECSGHDLNTLKTVLNILVAVFADMGGDIYSVEVQYGAKKLITPDLNPEKRSISVKYIDSILGIDLKSSQVKTLLERMMYGVTSVKGDKISITVPAFRSDIWHDVDVADDVGRAFGFGNIVPEHKQTATNGSTTKNVDTQDTVKDLMVSIGYQQAFTLALTSSEDQFAKMNMDEIPHIKLGSVADKSLDMVRVWLIPELLKCLVNNRNREYPQKFFETNYVIKQDKNADVKAKNVLRFCALTAHKNATYTEIRQSMDYVLDNMDIPYSIEDVEHPSFIPGRVGRIIVNGKKVGFIGEIHPKVLVNLGLEVPVSAVEINFTDIFESS